MTTKSTTSPTAKTSSTRKVWEEIQAKFDNKEIIEAPVVDAVKGGLVVDAGVRAFVPASMVSDHYVDNLALIVVLPCRIFSLSLISPSRLNCNVLGIASRSIKAI